MSDSFAAVIAKVKADLFRDVDLINSGWPPSPLFVETTATLLEDWREFLRASDGQPVIVGLYHQLDCLPEDDYVETSPIVWAKTTADGRYGVARSQTHWYLLGDRHRDGEPIPQEPWP